jgi:hypothetical protein
MDAWAMVRRAAKGATVLDLIDWLFGIVLVVIHWCLGRRANNSSAEADEVDDGPA